MTASRFIKEIELVSMILKRMKAPQQKYYKNASLEKVEEETMKVGRERLQELIEDNILQNNIK